MIPSLDTVPLGTIEPRCPRTEELFNEHRDRILRHTDRLFAFIMTIQWLLGILAASIISPRTWSGSAYQVHLHVWAAVLLGGVITSLPIALVLLHPGKPWTRHSVGIGQMLMSALLIHLTGGRIETHFHVFGSLAILAFYRDWKVLASASAIVALDHLLRGIYWPKSVFGVLTSSPWRWLEHAGWVLYEDIFLCVSIRESLKEMLGVARRQANLEAVNESIECRVRERTSELTQENAERRRAEQNLAEQEARIRTILNSTADGIITFDDQQAVKSFNLTAERIYGYASAEVLGKPITALIPSVRKRPRPPELSRDGGTHYPSEGISEQEITAKRKDGSEFPLAYRLTETRYGGESLHIAIIQDITPRKQVEEELAGLNKQLVNTARKAGMAEVASSVLHNVGNVLNTVNVSAQLVKEKLSQSKLGNLERVVGLMRLNEKDLGGFMSRDAQGRQILPFLDMLSEAWKEDQELMRREVEILSNNIDHIKDIVSRQQSLTGISGMAEAVQLSQLLNDVIVIAIPGHEHQGIVIGREYADIPPVLVDKMKLTMILVNLVRNANDSLQESQLPDKRLLVSTRYNGNGKIHIDVIDNGVGVPPENLTRIFSHGFTSKKNGHGFGLHSSALAAQELGGLLKVASGGAGKGATFTIELPMTPARKV